VSFWRYIAKLQS